ncbi:hypothetical protein OG215_36245 (plasmid) [Streptomyces globisporus]|uniref:hypothetical protein n=1 Tax=Streptomyces globisporus TaxID=1908 RepID=UPI002F911758|nr:hypothetical protein OG215_36245 [Streptomyces globisporus]
MPTPAIAVPQRLWDGDRIAQTNGPRVWHRRGGQWINHLNADGTGPFRDDQVRAGLAGPEPALFGAHPRGIRTSLRFIPRQLPTGPLPGSPLRTADAIAAAFGGLSASGSVPYTPEELALRRVNRSDRAPALVTLSLAALQQLLVERLEGGHEELSFHRPAGRFHRRTAGSEAWTYVLVAAP